MRQEPEAGKHLLRYAGDFLELRVFADQEDFERAYVRSNCLAVQLHYEEVIANVEEGRPMQERNWADLPMVKCGKREFRLDIPLFCVGVFDFKACCVDAKGRRTWCCGDNLRVKVEPPFSCAGNSIYNAFIRQFGRFCNGGSHKDECLSQAEVVLDNAGYTVIPPSGTFEDFRRRLPHIIDVMGFRFVMFLPVHPTPSTFARMGRFGSPFAPLDFFTVDPSMASFDRRTTPLEQFKAVMDKIHASGGYVMLDMPLDHTGWASQMQVHHPEWFLHGRDGCFESPGAWGVTWADLCKLDFGQKALWKYLAEVALHWCRLGVDGFRCDAGYMVPQPVWEYITAKVRSQYPDTIFLLEGLGGAWSTTADLLGDGGMNWAYSEYFQVFGADEESRYLKHTLDCAASDGVLVNFAETHDNSRLAAVSRNWAMHRVASAALFSAAGAFGIANGVEWLATEKIDVHEDKSLNWGASDNIVDFIASVNALLKHHPAFGGRAALKPLESLRGKVLALLRGECEEQVLVLSNPDMDRDVGGSWDRCDFDCGEAAFDLLGGSMVVLRRDGDRLECRLAPGQVLCLSSREWSGAGQDCEASLQQEYRAAVMRLALCFNPRAGLTHDVVEDKASELASCPGRFLACHFGSEALPLVEWVPPRDSRRDVLLPQGHGVYIHSALPFIVEFSLDGKTVDKARSLPSKCGEHFAFMLNCTRIGAGKELCVSAKIFGETVATTESRMLVMPPSEKAEVCLDCPVEKMNYLDCGLCSNDFGSYTMARAAWSCLHSKYDALLAANLTREYPDDRMATLLRMRAWVRFRDCSYELSAKCQTGFRFSYDNALAWNFSIACGLGCNIEMNVQWQLDRHENFGRCVFKAKVNDDFLLQYTDDCIWLILRPDVDARNIHGLCKAFTGPEQSYRNAVRSFQNGFAFSLDGRNALNMRMPDGAFHQACEWSYQQHLVIEEERGMEASTDVFSPGYFEQPLVQGRPVLVEVYAGEGAIPLLPYRKVDWNVSRMELEEALRRSLDYFVVRRNEHKSIIAGYPWFLDWGRDTLICLRGLIAAGMEEVARDAIVQFAKFIECGTLPNMIRGDDTSDRDTSDAPLWLFVVLRDFRQKYGDGILEEACGQRSLRRALAELGEDLWRGAKNGVRCDQTSGLLFSKAHFTWMDTNYPAGTPRTGYPVEIQALWLFAMGCLSELCPEGSWGERRELASRMFRKCFVRRDGLGLSDCLHADAFVPALEAEADDSCRPNQLLAIVLGALGDFGLNCSILRSTEQLVTPAGIRSLADAAVRYPLVIEDQGRSLNDPYHPYWGHYIGDEDSRRKPAYHNGTSWAWQMPLYCEAMYLVYGKSGARTGLGLLASAARIMSQGCLGFIPEIYDGDSPHTERGCPAQAWSLAEFYRVWHLLAGRER